MKSNRQVIIFLLKFFVTYIILASLYAFYLSKTQQITPNFTCSGITKTVANHSVKTMNFLGYQANFEQHSTELSCKIFVEGTFVSRVIEGCNAVSVMILFWAFIIAFKGKLSITLVFGFIGTLIIYLANIIRIALLSIGLYHYPKQEKILHDIVFPAIIYGIVFLLWLIWVNKYANKVKKNA